MGFHRMRAGAQRRWVDALVAPFLQDTVIAGLACAGFAVLPPRQLQNCTAGEVDEAFSMSEPATHSGRRMWRWSLVRRTRCLLADLGPTPDAVAHSLFVTEVRGQPGDPGDTPVGAFVSAVVGADPDVESVAVGMSEITITRRTRWRRQVTVRCPVAIQRFLEAFDAGCYPRLVRGHGASR